MIKINSIMCFCPPKDKGWILYGIANEIQKIRTKNKIIYLGREFTEC